MLPQAKLLCTQVLILLIVASPNTINCRKPVRKQFCNQTSHLQLYHERTIYGRIEFKDVPY